MQKKETTEEIAARYKEMQDPEVFRKMQYLGWSLNIAAFAIGICTVLGIGSYGVMCLLCMGFVLVSVLLPSLLPAYFSLIHGAKKKNVQEETYVVNTLLLFFLPMGMAAVSSLSQFGFFDYWEIGRAILVLTPFAGVLFWLLSPELRRNTGDFIAIILLFAMFSAGIVIPLNYIFSEPVRHETAVLLDKRWVTRSPPYFEIRLNDGAEVDIPAIHSRYYDYIPGDTIIVARQEGPLGIEYAYMK